MSDTRITPEQLAQIKADIDREAAVTPSRQEEAIAMAEVAGNLPPGPARTAVLTEVGKKLTRKQKPQLKLDALAAELTAHNFAIRFNDITAKFEITGMTSSGRTPSLHDLAVIMNDALCEVYSGASTQALGDKLEYLGRESHFNPVVDLLESVKWDETPRTYQLFKLMGIEEDDLSCTLVNKWLMQGVAMLHNTESNSFGADGCLVLQGPQQYGKTSLFRHLALRPEWFGDGQYIDDHDKDTMRRVVTSWITELGEIDSTLKSDISRFKAFITSTVDRYRLPYGREDITNARHTNLCGTVNPEQYLIDTTGNRRFWTIQLKRRMPYEEIISLDALQLWAEVYTTVSAMTDHFTNREVLSRCFRLTNEEQAQLAARNLAHEKPLKGQEEVEDVLSEAARRHLPFFDVTVSEWVMQWPQLKRYDARTIGAALTKLGIETKRENTKRTRFLPANPDYSPSSKR